MAVRLEETDKNGRTTDRSVLVAVCTDHFGTLVYVYEK